MIAKNIVINLNAKPNKTPKATVSIEPGDMVVARGTGEVKQDYQSALTLNYQADRNSRWSKYFKSRRYLCLFADIITSLQGLDDKEKCLVLEISRILSERTFNAKDRLRIDLTSRERKRLIADGFPYDDRSIKRAAIGLVEKQYLFYYDEELAKRKPNSEEKYVFWINPNYIFCGTKDDFINDCLNLEKVNIVIPINFEDK